MGMRPGGGGRGVPNNQPPSENISVSGAASAATAQEHKDRKKSFLNFTRVLMKYLENRDKNMHAKAKSVIRECAYENMSMQVRLRDLVGEAYWKKTEDYLCFVHKKDYEKKDGMDSHQAMRKAKEVAKIAGSPLPEVGRDYGMGMGMAGNNNSAAIAKEKQRQQ